MVEELLPPKSIIYGETLEAMNNKYNYFAEWHEREYGTPFAGGTIFDKIIKTALDLLYSKEGLNDTVILACGEEPSYYDADIYDYQILGKALNHYEQLELYLRFENESNIEIYLQMNSDVSLFEIWKKK